MEYQWMPMNEDLYDALWWQWNNRKFPKSPYVFVSDSKRHYGRPFKNRQKFMKGLCKKAGIRPFGFHALRRYVASVLADEHKLSSKRIQRILRHKAVSTTERYIQNLNNDMRDDLNLLCQPKVPGGVPEEVKGSNKKSAGFKTC
jgi:integrase